jgi:hypothetical protein
MPREITLLDYGVVVGDETFCHFVNIRKRSIAELNNQVMSIVLIGCVIFHPTPIVTLNTVQAAQ